MHQPISILFTPYHGNAYTRKYNGTKYATVRVKWNLQGITEFDSQTDTFEEDLIFYNYDHTAYATEISSYESELPDSYLDTQAGDPDDEKNCSVGTTAADEIIANTMYYTYMTLIDGTESDSSMFKVNVQEGYYIVFPSPWFVYAQTTNTVIPFKNGFTAPESRTWLYEFENNDTQSNAIDTGVGYWGSGTLASTSDVDYWKITGAGTKNFRLICPSGKDYDMEIFNSSGVSVGGCFSINEDDSYSITLTSGTYYMKIYSYSGSSTTENYRLMITNQ